MRIAYVINSLEGGGASSPVPAIAKLILAEGAAVRIFALTPRDLRGLPAMLEAGLDVVVRNGGQRDHLDAYRWLDREVRDWGTSHIWTSLTRATLIGQLVGLGQRLPVVSWQHNAYLKVANQWLLRATKGLSAVWIGDSECVTELTAQRLKVDRTRLTCWPIFAVDLDAPAAKPWQPGATIHIGSLGRLHPNKGYDVLIAALTILKSEGFIAAAPFEVSISGEGEERSALEAAIARDGLSNVRLPGFVDRPQDFLARCHLYLQPSRFEGFCIAAHQAMQAEIGVIAASVGEMQSSVDPSCGALVPPGDPHTLAKELAKILRHPEILEDWGRAAKRRVCARFGPEAFAASGRDVIRRIRAC